MNRKKVAAALLLLFTTVVVYGAGRLLDHTVQLTVLYLFLVGWVVAAVRHSMLRQRRHGLQALAAVNRLTVLVGELQAEQRQAKACIDDLRSLGTTSAVLLDLQSAPPVPPRKPAGASSSRALRDG